MNSANVANETTCRYYATTLIDLLGQSTRLQEWSRLPDATAEHSDFHQKLKKTVGVVAALRENFEDYFQAGNNRTFDEAELAKYPPEAVAAYKRMFNPIGFQHFSDTTVVYCQVATALREISLAGIFGMLGATALCQLRFLAAGHPPRGAIEIGLAGEFFEHQIYGPVLDCVNSLEKTIADYPRVVVGSDAAGLLIAAAGNNEHDPISRFNKEIAKLSLGYVAKDTDGQYIVDFLSKSHKMAIPEDVDTKALFNKGLAFATQQYQEYSACGNDRLARRYTKLLDYYNRNAAHWTA